MPRPPSATYERLRAFIQTAAMVFLRPGEASGRQNGPMTSTTASKPIEPRLAGMVAGIRELIPAANVRLYSCGEACGYGSRTRGDGRADSDVDLLITVPDAWLAQRDRFALLADLWGAVAQPDLSVDLVLHSSSEVARRAKEPGSLMYEALREGVLLDGQA
ncbi:nucleotidyltransferase domain-containing protein [Cyanobium sp. LEGE 06113]|uniref:nucleotidyltransferase domain-containing protein n=1 Tax=Cyanobium sp. LEGE 06113 TaxID=1297573 RepID=UPI00188125D0|nr:nucleotidyltransferase domain-containing protein [Cyanobium sp. LEGE 06113]